MALGGAAHAVSAARSEGTTSRAMRTMFVTWALIIGVGLAYFTVVGLTHH
jgi:hypothetical protein